MSIKSLKDKVRTLDRKSLVIAGLSLLLIILFVQNQNTKDAYNEMESSYHWEISELESKVAAQQEYITTVNSSIESISSEVDRFDYEDWRSVVPDVYYAVKEVENNIQTEP